MEDKTRKNEENYIEKTRTGNKYKEGQDTQDVLCFCSRQRVTNWEGKHDWQGWLDTQIILGYGSWTSLRLSYEEKRKERARKVKVSFVKQTDWTKCWKRTVRLRLKEKEKENCSRKKNTTDGKRDKKWTESYRQETNKRSVGRRCSQRKSLEEKRIRKA